MNLSVVIPVHNESANIAPLIVELTDTLEEKYDYELIYVDDASTDDTAIQLERMMTRYPRLRVIKHRVCCGQSMAIFSGVKAAASPLIATLDGDMQNDPKDIPMLVATYMDHRTEGDVMVIGLRANRQDTLWRKISSKIANSVRRSLLKDQASDTGCGLKVFSRALFLSMPYFDHMHRFLPALAGRANAPVFSVAVNHRSRSHGISNYGTLDRLKAGIVDLAGVLWLLKRFNHPHAIEVNSHADH